MMAKGSFASTIKILNRSFEPVFRPVPGQNSVAMRVSSIKETLTGDKEKLKQNMGLKTQPRKKGRQGTTPKSRGKRKGDYFTVMLHIAILLRMKLQHFI
jgi:hypothetical protein